jgi:hypothetical protein
MNLLGELKGFGGTGLTDHSTELELTVPASGEPTHTFKKIAHVIQPGDKFTVNLAKKSLPLNAKAHIKSYCSTQIDPVKIKVISITTAGIVNTSPTIPYPEDTTAITFELRLAPLEMILIGIILEVFKPGAGPDSGTKQYLCDPQIGNGPPPE